MAGLFIIGFATVITKGSLQVKRPTIWTVGKAEVRRERRESEKKEDARARKGTKVTSHCVFSNDLSLRRVEK